MKRMIQYAMLCLLKSLLWFRYRVTVKGVENLNSNTLKKPGGVLFLPNHPTMFVDPTLITMGVWRKYPIRPLVVEYMYYNPGVHWMMRYLNALPVPKFDIASNSLKKKRSEKVVEEVMHDLREGTSFLIYPAGKLKRTNKEIIGGASAVHQIITQVPEANVVLVRITGLWGSRFSYALSDVAPTMFGTILWGMKKILKNLIFFTPRREVTIEYIPAGPDFPYNGSRLEMNKYLENWYNRPDGIKPTTEPYPGESLNLVSYSMWSKELPTIEKGTAAIDKIDLSKIPMEIQNKVKECLAKMANMTPDQIRPEMSITADLGFDSLDSAELAAFLSDEFGVSNVPVNQLTTVGRVLAIAARQMVFKEEIEEEKHDLTAWTKHIRTGWASIPEGETIIQVFLKNSDRMGNAPACSDSRSGVLTYAQMKMRVILLADYIKTLPGQYIGILLPASVASYVVILACHLAGKVPMPINWTVGPRHLESVNSLSKVQTVLSSWSFIDRLENADLTAIEDKIVMLEDVRRKLTIGDKIRAFIRSKRNAQAVLRLFGADKLTKENTAVLLFTSGTEGMPKGVPLSHGNILANQRAAMEMLQLPFDSVLMSILPPFHSFGFTVSGLIPILAGMRAAYYPDPTNGPGLAREIELWRATMICAAPSFLKTIFKAATVEQLKTIRLCVSGAEKTPPELIRLAEQKVPQAMLTEGYGITECSPILTVNLSGDSQHGVGIPVPGVDICIVDLNTHEILPGGERGLILARGPNVFSGYLNPGLNSPFLTVSGKQWYNTGDLGYLDEQGNLILAGRLKRFIKVGPEMISLGAIEEALMHKILHKEVDGNEPEGPSLAICAKEEAGEKPRIVLVAKFPTTVDEANNTLKESGFSNLVRIGQVVQMEIPLLGTGKINYRTLEAQVFPT